MMNAADAAGPMMEKGMAWGWSMRRIVMLCALLVAPLAAPWAAETGGSGGEAPRVYKFSPVNQFGIELTATYWNPIIQYVSARSGVALALKIGRTSADTTSFVLAREVDFAFTNHLFSENRRKMGWLLLARRDYPPVYAQILTSPDSGITDLAQLAGQEVAFPGQEAFIAYKVTYGQLLNRAIPVKTVFGGNHDGAFAQLFSGKVKAVGVNSQLADGYALREKRSFRTLWTSEPFNDLALMASPGVPPADVKAVTAAFLGMGADPQGMAIIKRVSEAVKLPPFPAFIPVGEDEYTSYYDFFRTAPASLQ
jgi:phosphonate transport system substrate-binding protein